MSEKTKIKNFKFLPLSGKSHFKTYICWPVFSSVDCFVLKIEHGFFTMRDIGIVSGQHTMCTKKYRFALCFRVLSNQHVERSAYVNVAKFNRENERFERGKLNSRCTFCRVTRVRNIAHPRNLSTLFIYYSSTIFQFLDSI